MYGPRSAFQTAAQHGQKVDPQRDTAPLVGLSRIALVADKRRWAFDNIASHIKKLIERDYRVSIDILYTEDYSSPERFIEHLNQQEYDVVHWYWRKYLKDLVEHYVAIDDVYPLKVVLERSAVSFSIAEGLFTDADDVFDFSHIFHLADGYCTVSKRLYDFYAEQILLPQPNCVLYDRTDLITELIERPRSQARSHGDALHVLWAGNSEWGRWLGLDDAKGLRLIKLAIEKARQAGCSIHFTEFDAAKGPVSQKEVGDALLAADVYLCASGEQEGTPLPVIEAMAAGCAVITADVGVAREVFPVSQHELIVSRDVDAFASALQHCGKNLAWAAELGKDNRETMRDWSCRPLHRDWMNFFAAVYERSQSNGRREEKAAILSNLQVSALDEILSGLRRFVRKSDILKAIARKIWPYAQSFVHMLARSNSRRNRLRRLTNFRKTLALNKKQSVSTIAVYTPMWLGVAASTRALFKNSMPVPFFSSQNPGTVTTQELDEYIEMLRILSPHRLVLSGAEKLHWDLLSRYKKVCPQTRVEIISHSSQLQWIEENYREEFMRWLPAYQAGEIQKIWVLKRGLDIVLRNYGIEAEAIENYLPQKVRVPRCLSVGAPIKIGIWSVDNDWRKNLLSQFLAFAGETRFIVHHTATDTVLNSLLSKFGVQNIRVNEGPLPRAQLLSWMAKMDINLYVTLSECSPMIPLESMAMGVPVLVGPTTTYFDGDALLSRLVVPSPEDMGCIRKSVDDILAAYESFSEAIIRHGLRREKLFAELKSRLNGETA